MILKYVNKNLKKIIGFIYLLILLISLYYFFSYFDLKDIKNFDLVIDLKNKFVYYKNDNYLLFLILYILISVLWLLFIGIGIPLAVFSGIMYGKFLGTILFLIIISTSSVLFYLIIKFFFYDYVKKNLLHKYSNMGKILKKKELIYLILFKLIEGIPFIVANSLLALFDIKKKIYF